MNERKIEKELERGKKGSAHEGSNKWKKIENRKEWKRWKKKKEI